MTDRRATGAVPASGRSGRPIALGSRYVAPAAGRPRPIEAEGLGRRFGSTTAVAGVDLLVEPGEIFGFLGPNGAGKTTCVRMLVTLLRPTAGRARVAGFDVVEDTYAVRRAIGVALQEVAVDPFMTSRDLLHLQGALHGLDRVRTARRSDQLLDQVGLTAVATDAVSTFSGGMRRRLDLAMALLHEPQVLFLDEPTAGLDPLSRARVWDEVRSLNAEHGTTVFLTTHYLEEADRLAGRVAILDQGRIVREGRPEALKAAVGAPALSVAVEAGSESRAASVLGPFGPAIPAPAGRLAVRLAGGTCEVAGVIRALDAAGIVVESVEVTAPSMDDVFAAATGRRLERADSDAAGATADDDQ